MNIVFFGSSQFAVPSLKSLLTTKHSVSCVVTQPDRKKGRGLHFEGTAVKGIAKESGLRIYQPQDVNSIEGTKFLKELNPDLFIVIAYGQILSREILKIPKILSINIHASLLPKYRGAAPINWALICGEKITGVTIIKMTERMDDGPIMIQKETGINDDEASITLEDNLSKIAADLLVSSMQLIENNSFKLIPQDETKISFARKLKKEDGLINWNRPAKDIYNLVRGVLDWPGAFTYYNGRLLKIYKSSVLELSDSRVLRSPGEIAQVSKEGIVVACGRGNLLVKELQIEGKRKMKTEEFISGHKFYVGEILKDKK